MATYKLVDSDKLDAAMTATADAIRAKTGGTDPIAWDAEKGMAEAVEPVFEAGKKAEYDAFWDSFWGNIAKYPQNPYLTHAFYGTQWNDKTFFPKYDIIANESIVDQLFSWCGISDLKGRLDECGVTLDLSKAIQAQQLFMYAYRVTHIPAIDIPNAKHCNYMFNSATACTTIDRVTLGDQAILTRAFLNMPKLQNIEFAGSIGDNLDISASPLLSKESIESLITTLSSTISALSVTLSLTAVNNAFETSAGAADGSTSEKWATLIATKSNWTISLV